jgi:serine/threonine protein kinase
MKVYELCSTYENYYLIMEYCPLGTLKNYIKMAPPNENEAIRILKGICKGYEELYNNYIVHCDIKTDNILLAEEKGTIIPKISDFGCAQKLYEASMSMTKIEMEGAVGSPLYMSPQALDSDTHNYQSDIFSIGSLFYEILFGQHPFPGETLATIKKSLAKGDFYMDTTKISKQTAEFILGCLHYNEMARYHIKDIMKSAIFNVPYEFLTKFGESNTKAKFSIHSLSIDE